MANPTNLPELADSLAALADAAIERARQGPNTTGNVNYHAGYREALLDTRATVLAMIAAARRGYYVIQEGDVGKPSIRAFGRSWMVCDFLGRVLPGDVGKRVYIGAPGVLSVENDEQRDKRLACTCSDLRRQHGTHDAACPLVVGR